MNFYFTSTVLCFFNPSVAILFNIIWNEDYKIVFGIDPPDALAIRHCRESHLSYTPTSVADPLTPQERRLVRGRAPIRICHWAPQHLANAVHCRCVEHFARAYFKVT